MLRRCGQADRQPRHCASARYAAGACYIHQLPTLFGRIAVREPLVMRVGYGVVGGQSDFLSNILRWIAASPACRPQRRP